MIKTENTQIDLLTGLLNRKKFIELFTRALEEAKRTPKEAPLSLALLDIDNFFNINEEFGHAAGDQVLVAVAEIILAHSNPNTLTGRYGGDEFVILFPGEEREQAFLKVEQIRQELSRQELVRGDNQTIQGIHISGGVASFPIDGRTEYELLRKADQALYRAKASGRNQIRLAYEERMVPKTTHYTQTQLERLSKLAQERGVNEADLLREAMDDFLTKYGVNDIET
jgi:diguanylate cyclase (GGDEF)-like protein